MAKLSSIVKNERRRKLAAKQSPVRKELKKILLDDNASDEDRQKAAIKLQKLNRNGSPVRVRNRCKITGRSRGYYQKFGISRIKLREMANEGLIPGVTKASW
jgi:small subunit ribosomal protein S14